MGTAKLRCRLTKPKAELDPQVYLRGKCMNKDVQSEVQEPLKEP